MRPGADRGLSRRTFLKLIAMSGAAAWLKPVVDSQPGNGFPPARDFQPGCDLQPLIASSLPLPYPHHYVPDADTLLTRRLSAFDVLLIPAYAAAALIRRGEVRALTGEHFLSLGRAHDPDGAFTLPHVFATGALLSRGASLNSLADLWRADAVWPDSARLVIGAALMRRGYSPNDIHSGHMAQIEQDLRDLRPRLAADPWAEVRQGAAEFAFAPLPISAELFTRGEGPEVAATLPTEGALLIEYDWVIPRRALNAEAALRFLRQVASEASSAFDSMAARLTPLTPLSDQTLAQRAALWARIRPFSA